MKNSRTKMDVETVKKALVVSRENHLDTAQSNVSQKILEEEEYLSILDSIVERDFYPELTKLKLRSSYLDALESNDLERLRQIQIQLDEGNSLRQDDSPSKFDADDNDVNDGDDVNWIQGGTKGKDKAVKTGLRLDRFLLTNTSEDNASFEKVMQETRKKHKEKYAWLYQEKSSGGEGSNLLIADGKNEPTKLLENRSNSVDTWSFVARNSLMYPPEGVELSAAEILADKGKKEKEIRHENTRFNIDPFDSIASQTSLVQAAQDKANMQKAIGKVGVDGKLEQPIETPQVKGYSFVATPSPMPGVDQSPLMTWGAIEGTPMRLDATPAHVSQGPNFKIAEPPRREQLAHSLAEKASKQHRNKRKKALAAATSSIFSPKCTPRNNMPSERLSKLTPAAQKLIKSSLSMHTDKSLRVSYTPTLKKDKKDSTPNVNTPGSRHINTPGTSRGSSITDNLLNIPDI